jgi:hypothetical protein
VEDARIMTLNMWVRGSDEDGTIPSAGSIQRHTFDENLRKLQRLLWTPRRQIVITKRFYIPTVELTDAGIDITGMDEDGDYVLISATTNAQYVSGLDPTMNGQTKANLSVDLKLTDPFWYGDQLEIQFTGVAPTLVASDYSQPHNPSPQTNDTGWSGYDPESVFSGSTATRTALAGVDPTQYGEVVTLGEQLGTNENALLVGVAYGRSTASDIPVTEGLTYVFSMYGKILNLSSQVLGLRIRFYNSSNALVATADSGYKVVSRGVFERLSSSPLTIPATVTHAKIIIRASNSGTQWRGIRKNAIPLASYPTIPTSGLPFTLTAGTGGAIVDIPVASTDTFATNGNPATLSGSHIVKYTTRPNASTIASGITASGTLGAIVVPLTTYMISCYIASSRLQSVGARINVVWYDSAGVLISTTSSGYVFPSTLSTMTFNPEVASHWTAATAAALNQWNAITYGNSLFVAVAGSGTSRVMTSPDGITWTSRTAALANNWTGVAYGAGLYVAISSTTVGTSLQRVMTSPDGITWTIRNAAYSDPMRGIVFGAGLFVVVSDAGVMTSPDGITWTSRTPAAANAWQAVTYGNGLYVAVSNTGANRVMTSPDGITWTSRTAAAAVTWTGITYGNGLYIAIGNSGTNRCMTSPDGITWTQRTIAAEQWTGIAYGVGVYVAVSNGVNFDFSTSPDGITWTSRDVTPLTNNPAMGIVWSGTKFVAVGSSGSTEVTYLEPHFSLAWQRLNLAAIAPETAAYAAVQIEISDARVYQAANSDFWAIGAPMINKGSDLLDWFWGNSGATSDGLVHSWDATSKVSLRAGDSLVGDRAMVTAGVLLQDYYDGATAWADPDRDYVWEGSAYDSRSVIKLPDPNDVGDTNTFTVIGDARTNAITAEFEDVLWAPSLANITDANNEVSVKYLGKILGGDSADIDVVNYEATKTVSAVTTDDSGLVTHEGSSDWLYLDPGEQLVRFRVDAGNGTAVLRYQPRWF